MQSFNLKIFSFVTTTQEKILPNQNLYIHLTTFVYNMAETISVRIDKSELKQINEISKLEKKTKSHVLREVLEKGIKEKKLDLALEKFRKNEATAWKAARMADIPLTAFMDILVQKGIDFHYGVKELREDFEGLI